MVSAELRLPILPRTPCYWAFSSLTVILLLVGWVKVSNTTKLILKLVVQLLNQLINHVHHWLFSSFTIKFFQSIEDNHKSAKNITLILSIYNKLGLLYGGSQTTMNYGGRYKKLEKRYKKNRLNDTESSIVHIKTVCHFCSE